MSKITYSVSSKDPTTGLYKKDFGSKQELVQKDPTDIEHVRDIENDDKNLCSIHAFYFCCPFFFLPTFSTSFFEKPFQKDKNADKLQEKLSGVN